LTALPTRASGLGAHLHAAVATMFFALGIGAGLWGGASGAILIRSGVDASTFGVLLTVYTGAYLIAMSAGGALAHRSASIKRCPSRRSSSARPFARCSTPRVRLGSRSP
jgi:hypothetical protein